MTRGSVKYDSNPTIDCAVKRDRSIPILFTTVNILNMYEYLLIARAYQ